MKLLVCKTCDFAYEDGFKPALHYQHELTVEEFED